MNVNQPLYEWLLQTLKQNIVHECRPHQKMQSERELSALYHVSRTTVRTALKQLEIEGYIYKQQGKGTFVSQESDRMANLSKMYSFTDHMLQLNKKPKTRVLSFEKVEPNRNIIRQMALKDDELVFQIIRLRLADNEPLMLETTYMPERLFKNLTRQMVEERPLYTIVSEEFNEIISLAKETFLVGIAQALDAKHLEIESGAPVFQIQRQTYDDKGMMIELTNSIARGDKFRYQIQHQRTH